MRNMMKGSLAAMIAVPLLLVMTSANITEIEKRSPAALGYWYLNPKDFDTGVLSYLYYPDHPELGYFGGVPGRGAKFNKQFIASDGSYEKLVAYDEFDGFWFCTVKYKLKDNPLIMEILDLELTDRQFYGRDDFLSKIKVLSKGTLLYKGKYSDGSWVEGW